MKVTTFAFIAAANAALASANNAVAPALSERDVLPLIAPANDTNPHPLKQWDPKNAPYKPLVGPSPGYHHGPSPSPYYPGGSTSSEDDSSYSESATWSDQQSETATWEAQSWSDSGNPKTSTPEVAPYPSSAWGASQAHHHHHGPSKGYLPSQSSVWSAPSESETPTASPYTSSPWVGPSQWHHKGYSKSSETYGASSWYSQDAGAPTTVPTESSYPTESAPYPFHKGASQYHHHHGPSPSPSWTGYNNGGNDNNNEDTSSYASWSSSDSDNTWESSSYANSPSDMPSPAKGEKPKYWPSGSARARLGKDNGMYALYGRAAAAVCGNTPQVSGAELTACPMENGVGGYECINTSGTLESCGGCMSLGEAQDCTLIKGADNVGCVRGKCIIGTCMDGYYLDSDKMECIAN